MHEHQFRLGETGSSVIRSLVRFGATAGQRMISQPRMADRVRLDDRHDAGSERDSGLLLRAIHPPAARSVQLGDPGHFPRGLDHRRYDHLDVDALRLPDGPVRRPEARSMLDTPFRSEYREPVFPEFERQFFLRRLGRRGALRDRHLAGHLQQGHRRLVR